ncbi:unnamed protein product [Urochloa decumbens]|uniref:Transcription factor n=1 Tax=Urochloa decumbens TaxID=240449 RepID=A0ABC9FVN7_9POAL
MDDQLPPCTFFSPSPPCSLPSFSSHTDHPVIEFASCEVPEQWLLGDVVVAQNEGYNDVDELWAVALPRAEAPTGAERKRREKLNRRFCDPRAAVRSVSRMDEASLLADAAVYIAELRARIAQLEAEATRAAAAAAAARREPVAGGGSSCGPPPGSPAEAVEVRMLGPDAATVRATSAAPHAAARLMGALRSLDLHVQHACVTRLHGVTVQDAVVDVPAQLQDGDGLRAALLQMLQ